MAKISKGILTIGEVIGLLTPDELAFLGELLKDSRDTIAGIMAKALKAQIAKLEEESNG